MVLAASLAAHRANLAGFVESHAWIVRDMADMGSKFGKPNIMVLCENVGKTWF